MKRRWFGEAAAPRGGGRVRPALEALEGRAMLAVVGLDPTFGGNGVAQGPVGASFVPGGVATQPNGQIVSVGLASEASGSVVQVVRVNANGSADSTFGKSGS